MPWDEIGRLAIANGPLGVIALVEGFIIFMLYREVRKGEAERLTDAKSTIPVLQSANSAMAAITAEMASRTDMAAGMGEAIRSMREAQQAMAAQLEKMHDLLREGKFGRRA